MKGLIKLHGGTRNFISKLDEMLATPPHFHAGDYGFEIHEMSEMAAANFGQYAHSNQPVHNVLYLFAEAGAPEKTNYWVHRILTEYYNDSAGGFPGDEDNGEMSAWYVLSALGIFATCPGKPEYILTRPLFREAKVRLGSGSMLNIVNATASDLPASVSGEYFFNSEQLGPGRILHEQIQAGGQLVYRLPDVRRKVQPPILAAPKIS
jgi:putative alpha-1,2-mannosidase